MKKALFTLTLSMIILAAPPLWAQKAQPSLADLEKSAAAGNAKAQTRLGIMYYEGSGGVKQDNKTAASWFSKAAAQNNTRAQYYLGLLHENRKNYMRAWYWYERCSILEKRPCGGFDYAEMFGKIRTNASEKDFDWLKKKAEEGNDHIAQNMVGLLYNSGILVEADPEAAIYYFYKSAELGNGLGQFNLAQYYYKGIGTEQSYRDAFYWYKKSAEQGYMLAQYNLGVCYLNAEGTARNIHAAYTWFKLAADQGYQEAINVLKQPEFAEYVKDKK